MCATSSDTFGLVRNRQAALRDSPRSVLGPASSCLNLSSREASLLLRAEPPSAFGSDVPLSETVAEWGRDWDRCRGTGSLVLSRKGRRTEGKVSRSL